jgi:hypothetical protein
MHRFIFVSTQATSVGLLSGPHGLLFLYLSPDLVGIMLFMWRTFISQKKNMEDSWDVPIHAFSLACHHFLTDNHGITIIMGQNNHRGELSLAEMVLFLVMEPTHQGSSPKFRTGDCIFLDLF